MKSAIDKRFLNKFYLNALFIFTIIVRQPPASYINVFAETNTTPKTVSTDDKEARALLAWKASLDLQSQAFLSSWNGSHHCYWFGVSCNKARSVVDLNLTGNGITGTIRELNFSSLTGLISIVLFNNSFFGSIPFTVGIISGLTYLDLGRNNFTGSVPASIGNLRKLTTLYLDQNKLTGFIPSSVGNLRNLTELFLEYNQLSGCIPSSIGNLAKLTTLYLHSNQLSGFIPQQIGMLTSLVSLQISTTNLRGPVPASIGNLSNLNYLYIFENKLSGPIPHQIGMLKSLIDLDLSINSFTGQIPPSIGNLTKLTFLQLCVNQLSGPIPSEIGKLKSLVDMKMFENKLSGLVPLELNNITHLRELSLSDNDKLSGQLPNDICLGGLLERLTVENNNFIGYVPKSLKNCPRLHRVRLEGNQFTGNISEDFGSYTNLDYIDLSSNNFFGEISTNWGFCQNLTSLRISNNRLSGTIPSEIGKATRLVILDLSSNQLTGMIPKTLGNLTSMLNLDLSSNKLSGHVPSQILRLSKMLRLNLAVNNLSGSIPKQLGESIQLLELNFSRNMLTGNIPSYIGDMRSLQNLDLSQNKLTGKIPEQLGTLQIFEKMNLSCNEISGSIPASFSQCRSLSSVDISYNHLEGPLPSTTAFQKAPFHALRNNKGLCGNVSGLNPCSPTAGNESNGKRHRTFPSLIIFPVFGSLVLTITAIGLYLVLSSRTRSKENKARHEGETKNLFSVWSFHGKLAYETIIEATEEFNHRYCIGRGGTGSVFRAQLPSGQIVAVKKLHPSEEDTRDNLKSFRKEVTTLTKIRHRNIVKLHGFCQHAIHSFLVYEFLEGGSLLDKLNNEERAQNFDWITRVNVIKGVANALSYLHHDCSPPILHRDISSKNVLLDSEFNARISNFGVAQLAEPHSSTPNSFAGTYGYVAPELALSIVVSEKYDVYSFGVVATEVIMGKHPEMLITFMLSASSSSPVNDLLLKDVLDKRLSRPSKHEMEELILVAKLALACLNQNPLFRPTMQQVSQQLSRRGRPSRSLSLCPDSITIGQLLGAECSTS